MLPAQPGSRDGPFVGEHHLISRLLPFDESGALEQRKKMGR
jgi:hypothetical protein